MSSKGDLISHLTCLMYVPCLGILKDPENHKLSHNGTSFLPQYTLRTKRQTDQPTDRQVVQAKNLYHECLC